MNIQHIAKYHQSWHGVEVLGVYCFIDLGYLHPYRRHRQQLPAQRASQLLGRFESIISVEFEGVEGVEERVEGVGDDIVALVSSGVDGVDVFVDFGAMQCVKRCEVQGAKAPLPRPRSRHQHQFLTTFGRCIASKTPELGFLGLYRLKFGVKNDFCKGP